MCSPRFDYTTEKQELVIRMPSAIHDVFANRTSYELGKCLVRLEDKHTGSSIARIAKGIGLEGTREIHLPYMHRLYQKTKDKKEPDGSLRYVRCRKPGLVIEVAWSQRALPLAEYAADYIRLSKGEIRTVIGIDLNNIYREYAEGQDVAASAAPATFSIWRAGAEDSDGYPTVIIPDNERNQASLEILLFKCAISFSNSHDRSFELKMVLGIPQ